MCSAMKCLSLHLIVILAACRFCFCSFYNWTTHSSTSNSSPNFEVVHGDPGGLRFRSKRDKKLLNVDPSVRRCAVGSVDMGCLISDKDSSHRYIISDESAYVVLHW